MVLPVPLRRKSAYQEASALVSVHLSVSIGGMRVEREWCEGVSIHTSLTLLIYKSCRCFLAASSLTSWAKGYSEKCTVSFQGSLASSPLVPPFLSVVKASFPEYRS